MSSSTPQAHQAEHEQRPEHFGWSAFSYLLTGMGLYGFVGWLIGRWTGIPALFPAGMLTGLGCAIALIIFRVTRATRVQR